MSSKTHSRTRHSSGSGSGIVSESDEGAEASKNEKSKRNNKNISGRSRTRKRSRSRDRSKQNSKAYRDEDKNDRYSRGSSRERNREPHLDRGKRRRGRSREVSYENKQERRTEIPRREERFLPEKKSKHSEDELRHRDNISYKDSHGERDSSSYWNKYADKLGIQYSDGNSRERQYTGRSRSEERKEREYKRAEDDNNAEREMAKKRQLEDESNKTDQNKKTKPSDENVEDGGKGEGNASRPKDSQRKSKNTLNDLLTTRTGGAYIPPARLRMMQKEITDKSSAAYQRIAWEALKKSIHGLINKVNISNIAIIVRELMKENIVRGRGLLCRSIMSAQSASPTFTHVYAALVAIVNTKFPNIGELLLRRLVIQFRRSFKRNDKANCLSACRFIAHLVNQQVAHEVLALEILTLLMESPTDDSVEVAIAFLKECGQKLTEVSLRGINAIFDRLRHILHEGNLDKRVQYMIEVMFQVRKDKFNDHPSIVTELDLVEEEDQFTHLITLDEVTTGEDILNVFRLDAEYVASEEKYKAIRKEMLGEGSSESGSGSEGEDEGSGGESGSEEGDEEAKADTIIDNTETNLIALRRIIYLTIQSSLDFEECTHKLLRMELKPGQEIELCHMILDCCAQQRTFEKFFGLLAQRFCEINKVYVAPFQQIFMDSYDTTHRLDTNKLRNVAKFFAHLLYTDAISWEVLSHVRLSEEDTTSSSRIFIKILFQELAEYMGLPKLNERVKDPTLQTAFEGLFPRDNPKNTRFAVNFFTSIGLGGLTDDLREHLKSQPRPAAVPALVQALPAESSSSSDSESSSESSSTSSSESSSDSEDGRKHRSKSRKKKTTKKSKKVARKTTKKRKKK